MRVVSAQSVPANGRSPADERLLQEMFCVGVAAVSAELVLPSRLPQPPSGRVLVLAVGKAGAAMARVALPRMGPRARGLVLTPYGHGHPAADMPPGVELIEAGHPLPDDAGLAAARRVLGEVQALGEGDMLLMLVSGGGSSLLALPAPGVTLADKQLITRQLLDCGASISEINCVRKHLSAIKGGRLAVAAHPARVVTLAVSDIPGDDPALVASGPTVADRSTLMDARRILHLYAVDTPAHVAQALADPANETPTAGAPGLADAVTRVIARSHHAMQAAAQLAHAAGYQPVHLGSDVEGDATEVATVHAALALHHAAKGGRFALLSGGETTVVVRNPRGRGGRNGEYALALALALDGASGVRALACDTDGIDGSSDAAGAVVGPDTLTRARQCGLAPEAMLQSNLSHDLFEALGDLVRMGPTRTNVNDFRVVLVDAG